MTLSRRPQSLLPILLCAASLFSLQAGLGVAPALAAETRATSPTPATLTPDADLKTGVLPNGMHYAIMKNATPKGQVSLRLRIGSGALEEAEDQRGLAHFLEHMAFKGSTHVPEGEMVKILQRKGLAFGPDTNAFTEWSQTVYMLDLPESDSDSLDTGLMLMRETAGELTISAKALEPERGVVLSEERVRDTPSYRAFKANLQLQLEGQLAAQRMPIGLVDVIKSAPAERLRAFYHANYRPERATLVAVGDFDPVDMEKRIKARFSDWTSVGPATAEPDLGKVAQHGVKAQLTVIPGSSNRVSLTWVKPFDATPDSVEKRRRDLVDSLAFAVLNRRLEALSRGAQAPFISANGGVSPYFHSAMIVSVSATTAPDQWVSGLGAIDQEVRRLTAFGASPEELQREIIDYRSGLVNEAASANTRKTPDLAGAIAAAADAQEVVTSPKTDLALFDDAVATITAKEVSDAAVKVFTGSGPLVQMTAPVEITGGEAALSTAYAKSSAAPVTAPVKAAAVAWPYAQFGAPGKTISSETAADLDLTRYVFANGVRLTVKPTKFKTDQVLVSVNIGTGRAAQPKDKPFMGWAAQTLLLGGLKKISQEDMEKALNGRTYETSVGMGEQALVLQGATKPADLDVQLQVLAAYATDPGWRPEAYQRLRGYINQVIDQSDSTATGVLRRDLQFKLTGDDLRYKFPDHATVDKESLAELQSLFTPVLTQGGIEVSIVGDVTRDAAVKAVAATFGSLPKRPAPALGKIQPVAFPSGQSASALHKGRADQALALTAWPISDLLSNLKSARTQIVLQDVFANRLLDQVRVAEGATYSPQGEAAPSDVYPGYGVLFDFVETPPAKVDRFFANVAKISTDLSTAAPTPDELDRAIRPKIERTLKSQQTNEYWLAWISGSAADPRRLDVVRSAVSDYRAITPADVLTAAQGTFKPDKMFKLVISPAAKPAGADAPAKP